MNDQEILKKAKNVLTDEADAIKTLADNLDEGFLKAVRLIIKSKGQIIITGLGKSGLVGRKISATLTSTGTPSVFVHPVEALHGDMGIVTKNDILLSISKSGCNSEIVKFAQSFRRIGGHILAITENEKSPLGTISDIVIPLPKIKEVDPMEVAPTTSTTLTLALGDALAIVLLSMRGFTAEDFAKYHPDGTLGRKLLLRAKDIMFADEKLPCASVAAPMKQVILEMTSKGLGLSCIVDKKGKFFGTLTDGDLRRLMQRAQNPLKLTAEGALDISRRKKGPRGPFTVTPDTLAIECREIMKNNMITCLVVLNDDSSPVGIVRIHEITAAGL
jgi:arabinose-5-phosphate isomerase